jgi:formate dehydrogenase subunit gamma
MQRIILPGTVLFTVLAASFVIGAGNVGADALAMVAQGSSADYYQQLIGEVTGDWRQYGEVFTELQGKLFWKLFLGIITLVPLAFFLHYVAVGAKEFSYDGPQILFFTLFNRIVHHIAAASFALLAITGLMVILGVFLGGGTLVRGARYIHVGAAIIFGCAAPFMFVMWVKDMLPASYDIKWLFIMGGYLSKEKTPVPAGKYNAGQKMWFWGATAGGGVMAYTGYIIWGMAVDLDTVRLYTIIHNALGAALVAFFLTHLYMSLFAIKGSLHSMVTGYKPKAEVDIMHSRYKYDK